METQTQNAALKDLNWRYATKTFDSGKTLSNEALELLIESVRLSASSYGLQPYHVLVISDPELRRKMRPACWDQSQITDSSHLFVFAHKTDFDASLIDTYLECVADQRNVPLSELEGYGAFMKDKLLSWPAAQKAAWTARQAYIAIGNLLHTAARLKVDACPMEGFEKDRLNDILGLNARGLSVAALVATGYRAETDTTQYQSKVRRSKETLFTML